MSDESCWIDVARAGDLLDGGQGVRFELPGGDRPLAGFAVRFNGEVHAYLNRCAHIPVELDWQEGQFFDREKQFLVCATHGAMYDPASGACHAGPCKGARLHKLACDVREAKVYVLAPERQ